MSMPTEAVDALHEATFALKAEHARRNDCLRQWDTETGAPNEPVSLTISRAEAESIFAARIAAHEARLRELGWERKVRVEAKDDVLQPSAKGERG